MELTERANAGLHSHIADRMTGLRIARDASILDLGCGTGAFLTRLRGTGYTRLNGVDIALPAQMQEGISFREADLDAGDLPYADGSLDVIVSVEVFEHMENIGSLVREISRVLSSQGMLIITTPNVHSIEARVRYLCLGKLKQFDQIGDPTHVYPVFLHSFTRILDRHGLEVADQWGFPLDGSSPTSRGSLRFIAGVLRAIGLAATPAGDHLCMVIRRKALAPEARTKRELVASHYEVRPPVIRCSSRGAEDSAILKTPISETTVATTIAR